MGINIDDLLFLSEGYCYCCKDEEYDNKYICNSCMNLLEYVDNTKNIGDYKCYSPYLYDGRLSEMIQEYKFNNGAYLFKAFGELLVKYIKDKDIQFDLIIPVPLSSKKLNKRGYNQSELMANYIGKKLGKEVRTDVVIKIKNTKDQHLLSASKRARNLKDAFILKNTKKLEGKRILLLDDIVTSGFTIKTIIEKLEEENITEIEALTLATSNKESKYKILFKDI